MYPGTIINIIDQSQIPELESSNAVDNAPLYFAVSSFDRGPEDLREITSSTEFYSLYGSTMNFAKHGQPALQAANCIAGGAKLLIKRLVADDALLANLILTLNVTATISARKAQEGEDGVSLQYIQTGVEDETATEKYVITDTKAVMKWESTSVTNCKTKADVISSVTPTDVTVNTEAADDSVVVTKVGKFVLFVVTDNGRSAVIKSVKITADYDLSRNLTDMIYDLYVYDGTTRLASATATMNPDSIYNRTQYGFNEFTTNQVKFYNIDGEFDKYLAFMSSLTGMSEEDLRSCDLILGKDSRGASIGGVSVDPESIALDSNYGVEIINGSDGSFAEKAFGNPLWTEKAVEVFDGTFDDRIWDVDTVKISAIFDANYPLEVKEAIAEFVNFRKDCTYFRDYGTELFSYTSIMNYQQNIIKKEHKSFNIADYFTTYEIYDPETRVRERVTMLYDMSRAAISIFADGAYRPLAGYINNMVLANAIEGTINFVPKITPAVNQKDMIDDARINYAIFSQGDCIVQALYTSKEGKLSQLSYVSNTLAIQEVARAVRTACPKFRYTFVTGTDFQVYADEVNKVLKYYRNRFAELKFVYVEDRIESMHKIFHAAINFKFGNWSQTEIFDLYALTND